MNLIVSHTHKNDKFNQKIIRGRSFKEVIQKWENFWGMKIEEVYPYRESYTVNDRKVIRYYTNTDYSEGIEFLEVEVIK